MDKTATVRRLRRGQTLAERTLWALVRNRRLGGYRFLRRVAMLGYIGVRFRNARVLADPGGTAEDIPAVLRSDRP